MLTVALLAASSVLFFSSSEAFAFEPGEHNGWNQEIQNNRVINAGSDISEARSDSGTLVQVWRGVDNQGIWVSVNHGAAQLLPNARTAVSPVVIFDHAYGDSSYFRVFHTGVNGWIFHATITVNGNLMRAGAWNQVPNDARTPAGLPVAATIQPHGGVMVAWRGQDTNDLYTAVLNGQYGYWEPPVQVLGARSDSAPALSFEPRSQTTMLAWRGTDNQVNVARQSFPDTHWWGHDILAGMLTDTQPAIAMTNGGQVPGHEQGQVAVRQQTTSRIQLTTVYAHGGWAQGRAGEGNGLIALYAPVLVAYAATVFLLVTSWDNAVYWKQSRQY